MTTSAGPFTPKPRWRASFSFAGFYAGQFIVLGIQLPFLSAWLDSRNFSPAEIGWVTGAALIARLVLGPAAAMWADAQADPRTGARAAAAFFAASAMTLALWPAEAKGLIGASAAGLIWSFGLLVPFSDTATLRADQAGLLHYGQTRAVGSLAFLATTILAGALLTAVGIGASVFVMAAAGLVTLGFSGLLPPFPSLTQGARNGAGQGMAQWREAAALLFRPDFLLMVGAAGLSQASHAVYYAYSILHWRDLGYSPQLVGVLWASGVAAEIVLLTRARGLAARLSPPLLIGLGCLGGVIRWTATACEPAIGILFFIQLFHALTFAAAYLGAVGFIARAAPPHLVNTAMTLTSTTGVGAMTGAATVIAGYVYATGGAGPAYLMMAGMGAFGLILSWRLVRWWPQIEPPSDGRSTETSAG